MGPFLDTIDDDTLINIFSILAIPDILAIRQVCKRFALISKQRIVWHNACTTQIFHQGIPFTSRPLASLSDKELERRVYRANRLGRRWRSSSTEPRYVVSNQVSTSTPIEEARFIPSHDEQWILTVSKGIWSKITLWRCRDLTPVAIWAPDRALFDGLAVNVDPTSVAAVAVSVRQNDSFRVEILSINSVERSCPRFESVISMDTSHKPITLKGDLLALADNETETVIWNWKTQAYVMLRSDGVDGWRDKCIQVVFSCNSILVVRSRSMHMFSEPILATHPNDNIQRALASHTFGWVDGIYVSLESRFCGRPTGYSAIQPLSALVRLKGDDPWSAHYKIQLWTFHPNPAYNSPPDSGSNNPLSTCPYIFPPSLVSEILSPHFGPLQCGDMILGPHGTAVWVQPADWAVAGLISADVHLQRMPVPTSHESLVAAIFPGVLRPEALDDKIRMSWTKGDSDSWTCLDYDEELGRIVLGSQSGSVFVLEI
ncbi:hypothetical protein BV22DRAFT_237197 [Leucogyrophana mollusca]|uniref:Uncharacterized protein n=1 Tax=Leucogyrophana mollusca TaxID=85980 RepID=A0ACB8BTT0_9AGAM|nr:hypothetical protein BV22DRAFT_237197 [Leucogyrophana mollusca]